MELLHTLERTHGSMATEAIKLLTQGETYCCAGTGQPVTVLEALAEQATNESHLCTYICHHA